jgi:MFS family permease
VAVQNKASIQILLIANAVSQFAQGISMIAIPWYFINNLQASSTYNLVFFVVTAATLIWAQYAGTLIDKYNRKHIFQGLCLVGLGVLSFAGFYGWYLGEMPLYLLILVFSFTVLNYNIHYPALYALAQELSDSDSYVKVNSLLEVQGQSTNMISGAAAALLIGGVSTSINGLDIVVEKWGLEKIFLMDASTYLIASVLLLFLKNKAPEKLKRDTGTVLKRLKKGWQFLGKNRAILNYGLFTYFVFVCVIVHVFYVMHLYISDYLQADGSALAIAQVFHTVGALTAGIFLQNALKRWSTINVSLALMGITLLSFAGMALTKNIWFFAPVCLLVGFANSGIRIARVTAIFKMVPKETIGRVTSVFQSANIFLRLILIGIFYLPYFVSNPEQAYWVYVAFIGLAMLPILSAYSKIAKVFGKSEKPSIMPGFSRIK